MKPIWIIRHGTTSRNSESGGEDRLRGWDDVPLNKAGREEAEKLARELKSSNIDIIFHSPLSRAEDTAKALAKTTGAKLVELDELKPWHVGKYTGELSKEAHPILARYCCQTPDKAVPGGESFNQFRDRVFKGLRKATNGGAKHPAVVSHYRVERLLAGYLANHQPADHAINEKVFLEKGPSTANAEKIELRV